VVKSTENEQSESGAVSSAGQFRYGACLVFVRPLLSLNLGSVG
jgi:hypothetical protein